jgi:secreted Zn-dependent insulinase-like peptidase
MSSCFVMLAGWANSLSAGEIDSSLDFGFFMIAIELTDIGQGMRYIPTCPTH